MAFTADGRGLVLWQLLNSSFRQKKQVPQKMLKGTSSCCQKGVKSGRRCGGKKTGSSTAHMQRSGTFLRDAWHEFLQGQYAAAP